MVDVATDDSLIVELDGIGHRSMNVLDITEQPSWVRMLLTEISNKDRVTNFETSDLCMILLTGLSVSNSL